MRYVTADDLTERFGAPALIQLTDRVNRPATTVDISVVEAAIADAEALIDGYVGKLYRLPLATVPGVLTRIAADIAWYYLNADRAEADGPEARNHKAALAWLKDVAGGTVALDADGHAPAQTGGGSVRRQAPERTFSRDSLRRL